jgi:dTDP-4-amino-4,6-dideoxygalactose transaminase
MNQNSNQTESDWIPFSKPIMGPEEEAATLRVLRSGWLTTGKEAEAFEQEFSQLISHIAGKPNETLHCIGVNSATAGMHLALDGLGVKPGDWVIVPSYTFVATAEVVRYLGAIPYFVDCEPNTFHLDIDSVKRLLTNPWTRRKIKGVISVHISGCSWRLEELKELCDSFGIFLVEDSAHAFPSACSVGAHGTVGTVGVFSFYANKTITTGEGGMVVTRNPELAKTIEMKRLHGIDRTVWHRYTNPGSGPGYDVPVLGYKYNLPDILAAIGREQLKKAQELQAQRQSIAKSYNDHFSQREWLIPAFEGDICSNHDQSVASHAWHLYILRLIPEKLTITRDQFTQELKRRNIGTSLHFIPVHRLSYYQKKSNCLPHNPSQKLLQTELISDSAISLPIFPSLTTDQIERIIAEILEIGDTHIRNHGKK